MRAPETLAFLKDQGAEADISSPEAVMKTLQEDVVKRAKVAKSSGARID